MRVVITVLYRETDDFLLVSTEPVTPPTTSEDAWCMFNDPTNSSVFWVVTHHPLPVGRSISGVLNCKPFEGIHPYFQL